MADTDNKARRANMTQSQGFVASYYFRLGATNLESMDLVAQRLTIRTCKTGVPRRSMSIIL